MNAKLLIGVAAVVAVALGAGYLLGRGESASVAQGSAATAPATATPSGERKILYYRNPMGLPDTSPTPKKAPTWSNEPLSSKNWRQPTDWACSANARETAKKIPLSAMADSGIKGGSGGMSAAQCA